MRHPKPVRRNVTDDQDWDLVATLRPMADDEWRTKVKSSPGIPGLRLVTI